MTTLPVQLDTQDDLGQTTALVSFFGRCELLIWDNRTTMHRARRYRDMEEVRDLRRTSIKGTGMTAEQVPAMAAE